MDLDAKQNKNQPSNYFGRDDQSVDNPKASLLEKHWSRLSKARDRLVDRNLRNRLISTNLNSSRTKNLRFSNGDSEHIFIILYLNNQDMNFEATDEDESAKELSEPSSDLVSVENSDQNTVSGLIEDVGVISLIK